MANEEHERWLSDGVESWNSKRKRAPFDPDLSNYVVHDQDDDELNRSAINLAGANLRTAVLGEWAQGEAIAGPVSLRRADLRAADLRGALLRFVDVDGADLRGANVRSLFEAKEGRLLRTDLSEINNLTQAQIDTMDGDTETILPEGLVYPSHWTEPWPFLTSTGLASGPKNQRWLPEFGVALKLNTASVLIQVVEFREVVRGNNHLAVNHPEFHALLLAFLDELSKTLLELEIITSTSPKDSTAEDVEKVRAWRDKFWGHLAKEISTYTSPEAVAKVTFPTCLILGLGAIGALLGGPIGFAGGSMLGQLMVGHAKPGAAAEKIADTLKSEETPLSK